MSVVEQIETTIPAGIWTADPVHSSVAFEIEHTAVTLFRGEFREFEATLDAGALTGSAAVASVSVPDETLHAHLQSPEFFDVERHPNLTFASAPVERHGDEVRARGELTVRGVTQPVRLRGTIVGPVVDAYGGERLGLTLETTVDRTRFGLNWNAPLPGGGFMLPDDVRLVARLSLVKRA